MMSMLTGAIDHLSGKDEMEGTREEEEEEEEEEGVIIIRLLAFHSLPLPLSQDSSGHLISLRICVSLTL